MFDGEDGDECRAPVSDEAQEVGDRGVEPVSANDGDRKDPKIYRKEVRWCVTADKTSGPLTQRP